MEQNKNNKIKLKNVLSAFFNFIYLYDLINISYLFQKIELDFE